MGGLEGEWIVWSGRRMDFVVWKENIVCVLEGEWIAWSGKLLLS